MSFLQPAILLALPLIALPIIIHLIHQRRFQTVHWAAMYFLLAANRMSRGYARLRQWLILAARTLALAGLVFALSRPLSSGWLGLASGGRVDTTIVLLDRSASMGELGPGGISKLQTGLQRLSESLGRLQSSRYVLIDSGRREPIELASIDALAEMPETQPISESADIPAMLQVAVEYIRANRPTRCELWICSDLRRADWRDNRGQWDAIRAGLKELPQMVRYNLLAYPEPAAENRSIRATRVRRVEGDDGARLLISFRIDQTGASPTPTSVPVQVEIDGGRSEFNVEIAGSALDVPDHVVPLEGDKTSGWGRISIPLDASPADNEFFFVYDREVVRRTLIVSEQIDAVRPMEFAAAVSPDPEVACKVDVIAAGQSLVDQLDDAALLIWHAPIPAPSDAETGLLTQFASRGGRIIFVPSETPSEHAFAGLRWTSWSEPGDVQVSSWMGDRDLLANTRSGQALPVGELEVRRHSGIEGESQSLATLDGGDPLLVRAMTERGNVYFCGTTASPNDSSLATSGLVLYALLHRAIEAGAQSLSSSQQWIAGEVPIANDGQWQQLAGSPSALSSEFERHAGVYRSADRWLAINRSEAEDQTAIVADERVQALFADLDFSRVDDQVGSRRSLIQEVWRLFLMMMMVALLLEAVLCFPRRMSTDSHSKSPRGQGSFRSDALKGASG